MSRKIVLVSCVSEKRAAPSPARDLYTSDWFTKAARYASQVADEWYILSARYGLVHPDQVLEPYNATLKTMGKSTARLGPSGFLSRSSRTCRQAIRWFSWLGRLTGNSCWLR